MESIQNKTKNNLINFLPEGKKNSILIAFSGGIDSTSLLNILFDLRNELNLELSVGYINHNLRGKESDEEEEFVTNYINKLKLPFYKKIIEKNYWDSLKKESIEMAARRIRYDFFKEIINKNKIDFIATAHNLNDKIETFFLQILRSGGIETLSSIPSINGKIIRPILNLTRLEIEKYVNNNNLSFIEDSTNNKNIYKRNIIRNKIIPVLSEIQPNFHKNFIKMFEMINEENIFFDKLINKILTKITISKTKKYYVINAEKFKKLSTFIQKKIIKLIIKKLNFPIKPDNILFKMLTKKENIYYKRKDFVYLQRGNLIWFINLKLISTSSNFHIIDKIPYNFKNNQLKFIIKKTININPQKIFSFKYYDKMLPLTVRNLRKIDVINTTKNIHVIKILKNMKIPPVLFDEVRILEEKNGKIIGFILGNFFRVSKEFYIDDKAENNFIFRIKLF